MVLGQQFPVHTGLLIKAIQTGERNQLHQILIAFLIFTEQDQMIAFPIQQMLPVVPGAFCHIDFTAEDRTDSGVPGCLIKRICAVHHAVIRQRHRRLSHGFHLLDQLWNAAGTVQQAVLAVDMEMHKGILRNLRHVFSTPLP